MISPYLDLINSNKNKEFLYLFVFNNYDSETTEIKK